MNSTIIFVRRFCLVCAASIVAAQVPAPAEPAGEFPKEVVGGQEVFRLGFEKLSTFPYAIVDLGTGATAAQIEEARKRDQIPDSIRFYHGKRIVLTGFMMPLLMEKGLAKKFVLMKDVNTCCFGATPNMNDYVVVTMKAGGAPSVPDVPVEVVGQLHVGEKYEHGYITSLFELEGEKFLGRKK